MASAPDAVVIGAPIDIATGARGGARHGPAEIRRNMPRLFASAVAGAGQPRERRRARLVDFDFRRTYIARIPTVCDLGDVVFMPGESNDIVGMRIRRAVELALQRDTTPILLGGDHSISWFALQAIAARYGPVGVIHFDAHADLYPPRRRIVHHGNPFVFALQAGHVRYLLQIGLRGVVPVPPDVVPTSDRRVAYVSARELQDRSAASVFRKLPRGLPCYLTFDVDCLAPHAAPETGAPVSGGLSFYQALELIDVASRRLNFVGADFVEVSGPEQWQNTAAIATARYVTQFLLRGARFERLKGYYVVPTFA
jgi:guanidinobutyrase